MDEQQNNAVLNESFLPRRRGRFTAGLLASAGAVLVAFPSWASSGPAAPAARPAGSADAAALTIVRSPLAKPPGGGACPDGWSMSTLHAGTVWVGDSATGRISVYRLNGKRLRVIDTRLGRDRLAGFALAADGRLSVLEAAPAPAIRLRAGSS
jgi:hypothetical protein